MGPAQAQPTVSQGRGGSWGTRASLGPTRLSLRLLICLKVVLKPFPVSSFLPPAPLIELGQGGDLQSIGRGTGSASSQCPERVVARCVRPQDRAPTSWAVPGHLSGESQPRREEVLRPPTGTWHAAVRFASEGCFYFRGLRERREKCPFPVSPGWARGAGIVMGGPWEYPKVDRCVGPRRGAGKEEVAPRAE